MLGGASGAHHDRSEPAVFGPFRLFPAARLLERAGKPVEIGARSLDILLELVNQAGRVVGKTELMSAIWRDTTVVEGALRTHVYNLRKSLGDGVGGARYVTSVAGRGYCFVAPVVRGASATATGGARTAAKQAHGLPSRLARMAGRDDVVQMLAGLVMERRFVTVLGAAGIGKTTVAVAILHALLETFGDDVRFVELGSLTDPSLVAGTVASALGVPTHTDDPLESLRAFLQDKRVLLVLDNCEHVVNAAASLAEHLFVRTSRVHVLTTSREALRVEGEHAHRLGPLDTPAEVVGMSLDTVQTFPAVQVFLERAAASGWSGELTHDDVQIVVETCRHLDGVPLSIELAASFVGQCGLRGMAAVLDDRLRLLWQRGRRTAPERQQTLHALIAWSYDRLPEHERVVLRRLSVFVGSFSFDAAKAIVLDECDSAESLLEVMNELVAKSLLSESVKDGAIVYRLLETTRVYALERLAAEGGLDDTSLRHARFLVDSPHRLGDLGNVRAALAWGFSSRAGYDVGVQLAAAAASMFLELGLVGECRNLARQALDVVDAANCGTMVEVGLQEAFAVSAMFSKGNGDDVRGALVRGIELSRALGEKSREVRLLGHLNSFLVRRGDFRDALEVAERSNAHARDATSSPPIRATWMLAFSHHLCGNQEIAEAKCEEALRLEAPSGSADVLSRPSEGLYSHPHLPTFARTLWLRGKAERALALARSIVQGVPALRHPFEKSSALLLSEAIFVWCGQWADAERLIDTLSDLVERFSLRSQRGAAMAVRGELLVRTGRPMEGCALLRTALAMQTVEQNASFASVYAGALAEGLGATGALADALQTVDEAIADAERRGAGFNLPELHRIKGVLLASGSPTAADDALTAAIELAHEQGALAWQLRAATTRTRERLKRGCGTDDLGRLATVYGRFTEGMETPDLRAARALIERHPAPRAASLAHAHLGIRPDGLPNRP
jgi:predicted ATPase/DNA-binding winged helix-turn-helix (wHTH) protein